MNTLFVEYPVGCSQLQNDITFKYNHHTVGFWPAFSLNWLERCTMSINWILGSEQIVQQTVLLPYLPAKKFCKVTLSFFNYDYVFSSSFSEALKDICVIAWKGEWHVVGLIAQMREFLAAALCSITQTFWTFGLKHTIVISNQVKSSVENLNVRFEIAMKDKITYLEHSVKLPWPNKASKACNAHVLLT